MEPENTHWNFLFNVCNFYLTLYRFILTTYLVVDKAVLLSCKCILKVYVEHILYKSHNDANTNIRKTECVFKIYLPSYGCFRMRALIKCLKRLSLEISWDFGIKIAWTTMSNMYYSVTKPWEADTSPYSSGTKKGEFYLPNNSPLSNPLRSHCPNP